MSKVLGMGDLHLGHQNIFHWRKNIIPSTITSHEEYCEFVVAEWNSVVKPRDKVFVFGDFVFEPKALKYAKQLRGQIHLIKGNHDHDCVKEVVSKIDGALKYKKAWLTHIPIHPEELRGCINIHGHTHFHNIDDKRYFNICPENIGFKPIDLLETINNVQR